MWCAFDPDASSRRALGRALLCALAFGLAASALIADVRVGSYGGNGTSQSIGALPWAPDAVIVKGENNRAAAMRSASMTGDQSKLLVGNVALAASLITSLDASGFSVGSDASVNASGVTYHWVAFKSEPSMMFTGSYTGNASVNRVISDPGFPCNHTIVMSAQNHKAAHSTPTSNRSYDFETSEYTDAIITPLPSNGFRIGDNDMVNKSGTTYHYVCWQNVFGRQKFASWFGDGSDNRERVIDFRPEYVFVNSITAAEKPTQRFRTIPDTTDQSLYFEASGAVTNHIQKILPSGIEVGDDDEVNKSGEGFAYFAWGPPGIGGRLFEDVDFAGTASDWDGGTVDRALPDVDVEIYDATDTLIASTTTNSLGQYFFGGLVPGTYKVRARSATIGDADTPPRGGLNGCVPASCPYPLAEMSWGAGAPRYGGQSPLLDDTATGDDAGPGSSWASVPFSGSDVNNANLGFAYNLIVNTLDDSNADNLRSVQGGLRQFIKNANAIGAANGTTASSSEFRIPATDPGYSAGRGVFTFTPAATLPPVTDRSTTLDATTQTANAGDSNSGMLGSTGPVGVDGLSLPQVARPEVEIVDGAGLLYGIDLQADDVILRGIAIYGFGTGNGNGNVRLGLNATSAYTGALFEDNIFGSPADSFTDPEAAVPGSGTGGSGVVVYGADGGIFRRNLVGFSGALGLYLATTADDWTIEQNEFRRNGLNSDRLDGISTSSSSTRTVIRRNLSADNHGAGIDFFASLGSHTVENNTLEDNGWGGTEPVGIRMFGSGSTIRKNVIRNQIGAGVLAVVFDPGFTQTPAIRNRITQNHFSGNGSNAIDLQATLDVVAPGDGITLNDGTLLGDSSVPDVCGIVATDGNEGLDTPIVDFVLYGPVTSTVRGRACPGAEVEIYRAVADGDSSDTLGVTNYGEGVEYLATTTAAPVTGLFDISSVPGLSEGDAVTAIAIDGNNNTSEFSGNRAVTALKIVKRAFQSDGTPISSGSTLPTGTPVKFLLYVDNPSSLVADASLQDLLDPLFAYEAASIKVDNTLVSSVVCPGAVCDESAIFSQIDGAGAAIGDGDAVTPPIDADVGSYNSGTRTIDLGDSNNSSNAQLDLGGDRVWAILYTIRMQ